VERLEHGVLVISVGRLIPALRSSVSGFGQPTGESARRSRRLSDQRGV
jgi:hypothetical protein